MTLSNIPSQIAIGRNYDKFRELIIFLKYARNSGIRFCAVRCEHMGMLKELRERYNIVLAREGIRVIEVEIEEEIESLYRYLKDELKERGITDLRDTVIFVYGLDISIRPYKEWPPFLAALNLGRDLFTNIPCPIVLILSNDSLAKMGNYAPDFWSWVTPVFEFEPVIKRPSDRDLKSLSGHAMPVPGGYKDETTGSKDIGLYEEMIREYKEIFAEKEDTALAHLIFELGILHFQNNRFRPAIECWNDALRIYRETGDRGGEARCYICLGNAYYSLGEYREAIRYQNMALEIMREIGDVTHISLENQDHVYYTKGKYEKTNKGSP